MISRQFFVCFKIYFYLYPRCDVDEYGRDVYQGVYFIWRKFSQPLSRTFRSIFDWDIFDNDGNR